MISALNKGMWWSSEPNSFSRSSISPAFRTVVIGVASLTMITERER
jgi:hypothetical protein